MPPSTNGQPPAVKNVGYIGLGNAGFSMASNLPKAGYNLVVHDVDEAKVQKAASQWKNTTAAKGNLEAFADCEVIVTMLPQGKIVREVLLGKDNFARALKPGMLLPYPLHYLGIIPIDSLRRHNHNRHLVLFPLRHNRPWQRTRSSQPPSRGLPYNPNLHARN